MGSRIRKTRLILYLNSLSLCRWLAAISLSHISKLYLVAFFNIASVLCCIFFSSRAAASLNPSVDPTQDVSSWRVAFQNCVDKLDAVFDIAINLVAYDDGDVAVATTTFIQDYLDLLKEKKPVKPISANRPAKLDIRLDLTEQRVFKLQQLLSVLFDKVRYPAVNIADDLEEFESDRRDYVSFIRGIARVDSALVLDGIHSLLQHALTQLPPSSLRVEDIDEVVIGRLESSLYLFFAIGEFYKAPKDGHFVESYEHCAKMRDLMSMICSSNISAISFFPIQLNFFEVIGRYDRYFLISPKYLVNILVSKIPSVKFLINVLDELPSVLILGYFLGRKRSPQSKD